MNILPTPEILAQAKSLQYYIEHLIDPYDPEGEKIFETWGEINAKYDFRDQIFEENGHCGLRDIEGHLRVPALYYDFEETLDLFSRRDLPVAALNDNRKCALVTTDGTGTPLCDFNYDHILLIQDGPYFLTVQRRKLGLMTSRGEELLPCEYDCIDDPVNGLFILQQGQQFGLFCEYGRGFTIPCHYDEIDEDNAVVHARLGQQWGYFDEQGDFLPEEQVPHPERQQLLRFISPVGM